MHFICAQLEKIEFSELDPPTPLPPPAPPATECVICGDEIDDGKLWFMRCQKVHTGCMTCVFERLESDVVKNGVQVAFYIISNSHLFIF
jgi:hypothetical protein